MVIDDKSWTLLGRHERELYIGLEKFVNHCKPLVNSVGNIRFPCKSCRTILCVSVKHLSDYIMRHGFDLGYKTWVHHGEPALPPPSPVIDNTRQPQMSDMTALLNDLSYILPNNEHNEPTQGDIGETSNEPTQGTRNKFEELYASANEELYPGCDYVTRLDFMEKFSYFKVKGKLTDSIFNEMLEFFKNVFPISKGYKLPPSYYAIKKTFKMIGLGYESIHACEHDCCLFRGDVNKDLDFCPVCNTSRWKDSNTPGKKVPKKVLRYFPIIPGPQRFYKSSHNAKEMTWHATGKCTEPGKMQHPVDDIAWKNFDTKYPDFAKEPRNVRQGLAADGFNPFGNLSQAYNMWRVILTTYNLPPWLCMKDSSFMLTLLIPGPKSLGKDIDVYLRPLIEDLKTLSRQDKTCKGWAFEVACGLAKPKNKKCLKPRAAYSFTPENQKKFYQFIKGVKLPDGFGSCFKHKVTDNDTNITGLKSHDCHIMMQRLLPYGLQNYLPHKIAKPIIELCSLFKQICSATLMEDDMLKAHIKVVDILCDLELIYPPALFDIMIHLVIHLPLEALEGGPIRSAKPEGSIAEGYVAEEALTFSSHYFRDEPRNLIVPTVMWIPLPQRVSFRCSDRPEIDTYRSQFKSLFPNKDMKEEFPDWFGSQIRQRHVDNDKDPEVSTTSELFALAYGPTWSPISINSCVVNGVRGVIVVEDDPDIIHFDNSYDLLLSTSLNDLDNVTLHIDGQSMDIDVPPDIIDVVDEDDDITDDEDALPRDLADSDNEDLINVDDDDVARSHSGDDGGEDLPLHTMYPVVAWVALLIEAKANESLIPSRSSLSCVTNKPLCLSATMRLIGLATSRRSLGTQFDLRPHMESPDGIEIKAGIQQHLQKAYNTNKAAFKVQHWVIDLTIGTYNVEKIRRARPENITASEWDKYIEFWNDPSKIARAAQNGKTGQKARSYLDRDPGRLLAFEMRWHTSTTQEYPSLIDTFFVAHTVNGKFLQDEERRIYRGHILGVGTVLPAWATASQVRPRMKVRSTASTKKVDFLMSLFKSDSKYSDMFSQFESGGVSGSGGCGDDEEGADHQDDEDEDGDGDT
nr:hypothetical protein [Tanacetum cinerariifolium]